MLAIQPHAHYRAREIRGTATLPDGTTRLLMHIKDWDFRWQHVYRLTEPVALPIGTRLSMDYTYDNSADNIRNPQLPPARVFWGQRSRDEMGDLWFQLLADSDADRAILNAQIARKMTAEDVIGYETLLRVDPKDVELHNDVAVLYLSLGQPSAAVRHFQAAVDLDPASASARFNLGTALTTAGRLDDGAAQFRAALGRRPDYAAAHNNLGRVLLVQGQTADALNHLEQAVRLDPANLSAFFNLSEAYVATGAFDRAIDALDRALRLSPAEPLATQLRQRRQQLLDKVPKFQGSRARVRRSKFYNAAVRTVNLGTRTLELWNLGALELWTSKEPPNAAQVSSVDGGPGLCVGRGGRIQSGSPAGCRSRFPGRCRFGAAAA